jgi:hypothetical protein
MRALTPPAELHLVVIAKSPVAGRVKTRLCPPYSPAAAAALAAAALTDTLEAVAATPARARTLVLDGAIGPWLPPGVSVIPQRGTTLDERLAAAFDDAQHDNPVPVLLVGMDTPQITSRLLASAGETLLSERVDAVLGLAADGGFWCMGLRHADPALLLGVPMSTPLTGAAQRQRLVAAGLRVAILPQLVDVDDAMSARTVAEAAPSTRFAAVLESMAAIAS